MDLTAAQNHAASPQISISQPIAVVSSALTRRLGVRVVAVNVVTLAVAAGVIAVASPAGGTRALGAAAAVGLVAAGGSVAILMTAAGRTVDWLVTIVMAASGVRLFVSLIGLLVAVKAFNTSPEWTAGVICALYVATLAAESVTLATAAGENGSASGANSVPPQSVGGRHV